MNARQKLNNASVAFCLLFAVGAGLLTQSFIVFVVMACLALAVACQDGAIRGRRS